MNQMSPYICGQCGHECKSVQDQFSHFQNKHKDFLSSATSITGIQGGANEIIEGFQRHDEVIEADPVTLLHKLQKFIAATHIATNFDQGSTSPGSIDEELQEFLLQNVFQLENQIHVYPSATEIYCHLAYACHLLGMLPMAADYWVRGAEVELENNTRVFDTKYKKFMQETFTLLGDEENAIDSKNFPKGSEKSFLGKVFGGKQEPVEPIQGIDAWPQRRKISDVISSSKDSGSAEETPFFREVLSEFRFIFNNAQNLFQGLLSGELDEDDIDFEYIHGLDERILELKELIGSCNYLPESTIAYWRAHIQLFYVYRMARRSEIDRGISAGEIGIQLIAKAEEFSDHPSPFTEELISTYGAGQHHTRVHALLAIAALNAQDDRYDEALEKYKEAIEVSKGDRYEKSVFITACIKTVEHCRFNDKELAEQLLKEAIEYEEGAVGSLEQAVRLGDHTLLRLKDYLATHYEFSDQLELAAVINEEISPYEDLITWRQKFDLLQDDDDED